MASSSYPTCIWRRRSVLVGISQKFSAVRISSYAITDVHCLMMGCHFNRRWMERQKDYNSIVFRIALLC